MKSPFYFICKSVIGSRYDNVKKYNDIEIIVNTSEEDHRFSNRFALVCETPINYTGPIVPGDILLVHHNAFKFYNDIKGKKRSGMSFFKEDIFLIEYEQFFMYKHNDKWHTHDRYCFVKPIPAINSYVKNSCRNEPLMGIMKYPNDYLLKQGVNEGVTVCYTPDSEYEFTVDGEKLYRIFDHQITAIL